MTVSPRRLLERRSVLDIDDDGARAGTHKRSETKLKKNDTGIWRKRPTDARAFAERSAKPNSRTSDGAYVSKPRWGPLLQSVMRTWIHTRQLDI